MPVIFIIAGFLINSTAFEIIWWSRLAGILVFVLLMFSKENRNFKPIYLLLIPIAIRYSVYLHIWSYYHITYKISLALTTLLLSVLFFTLKKHRDIPLATVLALFSYFLYFHNMPYAVLTLTAYLMFLCTQNFKGSIVNELYIRILKKTSVSNYGLSYQNRFSYNKQFLLLISSKRD